MFSLETSLSFVCLESILGESDREIDAFLWRAILRIWQLVYVDKVEPDQLGRRHIVFALIQWKLVLFGVLLATFLVTTLVGGRVAALLVLVRRGAIRSLKFGCVLRID